VLLLLKLPALVKLVEKVSPLLWSGVVRNADLRRSLANYVVLGQLRDSLEHREMLRVRSAEVGDRVVRIGLDPLTVNVTRAELTERDALLTGNQLAVLILDPCKGNLSGCVHEPSDADLSLAVYFLVGFHKRLVCAVFEPASQRRCYQSRVWGVCRLLVVGHQFKPCSLEGVCRFLHVILVPALGAGEPLLH